MPEKFLCKTCDFYEQGKPCCPKEQTDGEATADMECYSPDEEKLIVEDKNYADATANILCPMCHAEIEVDFCEMPWDDSGMTEHECKQCNQYFDIKSSVKKIEHKTASRTYR